MGEKQGDVVYTPSWVVSDMLAHFRPTGRVLDPCRGLGAFTDRLPSAAVRHPNGRGPRLRCPNCRVVVK